MRVLLYQGLRHGTGNGNAWSSRFLALLLVYCLIHVLVTGCFRLPFMTASKIMCHANFLLVGVQVGQKCVRSMTHALKLYSLQTVEVLRDSGSVNKVLVSYGPGLILLSFRGTVNLANVKEDLQVRNPRLGDTASREGRHSA